MENPPSGKSYIFVILALVLLGAFAAFFSKSVPLSIFISALILASIALIGYSHIKSSNLHGLIELLYEKEKSRDRSLATGLINELLTSEQGNRSRASAASELISSYFKIERFAVFFREGDKFVPRIYSGIHPASLNKPGTSRIRFLLREIPESGRIPARDEIMNSLFRKKEWEYYESPAAFVGRWGRFNYVILAADDEQGLLGAAIDDPEFNRVFWPVFDSFMRQDVKLNDTLAENKRLQYELTAVKKDFAGLNKDLNQKLLDLHSFVEISGKLYTIFNEDQLFNTLKDIVRSRMGAEKAEILCSDGDGRYISLSPQNPEFPELIIDADSRLFNLLQENAKPLLLPLVATGLGADDPFLNQAVKNGFQIASAIRVGNQMGCILLVSEKIDRRRYADPDLDFLSTIVNIASLSLENIRQYTTIEKLSYTDSMTAVFNYRYFYKRLIEEILRAKRFGRNLALVILDIDNFKIFNDKFGHQTGDLVLKRLARIITDTIRSIDVVSRYGGEEFCIIMPDTNFDNCQVFIERLRSVIADFRLDSEMFKDNNVVTVSVGGAVFPHHAVTADRLIYCADMALLKAKASGRNMAMMYQPEFTDKEESSIGGIQ